MDYISYTYPKDIKSWIEEIDLVAVLNPNLTEFKDALKKMKDKGDLYYLTLNEDSLTFEYFEKYTFKYSYLFKHYKLLRPGLKYIINSHGINHILCNIENKHEKRGKLHQYEVEEEADLMIENNIIHITCYGPYQEYCGLGYIEDNVDEEKYKELEDWFIDIVDTELDVWNDINYDEQLYIKRLN